MVNLYVRKHFGYERKETEVIIFLEQKYSL